MADSVDYASFMIRMWRDPGRGAGEVDGAEAFWVGEVEFVQSGRIVPFASLEGLVDLLVGRLSGPADFIEGGVGSQDPASL